MSDVGVGELGRRVLLQAPTARDAAMSRDLLAGAGISSFVCATIAELCREASLGAGAALVTAEAILGDRENRLSEFLKAQPQWSDLPVIILTPPGPDTTHLLAALEAVGPATLMKRPVQIASLVSAIRTSLRDRKRQYAVRDLLVERERAAETLRVERERYRVTLSSIGDAVIATDIDGRVTFLNAVAETLTGWTTPEASGRPMPEVFHIVNESSRQEVENPALKALAHGVIVGLANHTLLIARDGTERAIDDSAAPILDGEGKLSGAVLVFRDISERKQAEEARARLAAIVESSDDAIIGKTLDGIIQFWNVGAERVFGYTAAEALGKSITLIIPSDRLDEEREILSRLRRGIRIDHFETVRLAKDGRLLDISLTVSPIRDAEGHVVGASKVARDITDRKRADAELARLGQTLSLALGAAELGTWDWDMATDLVTLSDRGAEIYGLVPGQTYAREWMRGLLRADHRSLAREAAARAVRERTEYDIEYQLENGTWVSARGRGIYDENGALIRMLGVVQDVTVRRRAETELRQSEERHRVLVNATSDVAYRMSADWSEMQPLDGRDLVASNAGPIHDWMQKNIPASEHGIVQEAIQQAISNRSMFELEHRVLRPDGSLGWTFSRAAPILDVHGEIVEWFGTARDVTEQKRAAEELARVTAESERQRRLYEAILSATPDFVYVFSLDHRVLYANDALIQMWGKGREGAIGRTFLDIGYEPWHAEMHNREIDLVRTTKRPIRGEVPFNGTQGRRIYDYIFVPVLGADGMVEAVAGTTRDVTDRKQLEDALRATDRKKDDFIALLAHELRNPLAPIRNGLQVIRLAGGEGPLASVREMMDRQLAHMVRLIDDLLDVSRIGRNKMTLRRQRISAADVLANAVETARPALEEAHQELIVSLPSQPVFLDADLTRLAQVFSNLLMNSAKYTEPWGKVWLTAERTETGLTVTVRDTGIGIPAEALPTIFDMFSQVDGAIGRSAGGLGIGLALVKGLVEMHGGTVSAASDGPGQGSTFQVSLPLVPEPADPAAPALENYREGGGPARRVLVVDDNRDGAETMAMMLELIGNEVMVAHDGIEAVEQAERFRPELILMDVGMPRLDGLEATKRIRAQPWGRDLKIVALTGWGQEADRERSRAAECDGHLVKPVSLTDLQKLLTEMSGEK
jgi:PAS domain S-box-containing protein